MHDKEVKISDILDIELSQNLIDAASELTGLSVSLYLEDEIFLMSEKNCTEFCNLVKDNIDSGICTGLFPYGDTNEIKMCKAGLFCRIINIPNDENKSLYFSIGHRRIKGKKDISKRQLRETMDIFNIINQMRRAEFKAAFDMVPEIQEKDLFNPVFKNLIIINNYLKKEREMIEKERENTIRVKSLAADLAHQFQMPIQSIVAASEILVENLSDRPRLKNKAKKIQDELIKLSYYANDLCNTSELSKQSNESNYVAIDLHNLLLETVKLFREEGLRKNIDIPSPQLIGTQILKVRGSERDLKQALFNIIQNALKYSFEGDNQNRRTVDIICEREKDIYSIKISNLGIGIFPEEINQKLLFDDGYRGRLAQKWRPIGSGLGLPFAQRIITAHGGTIEIRSNRVGMGEKADPYLTTVKIQLPIFGHKEVSK